MPNVTDQIAHLSKEPSKSQLCSFECDRFVLVRCNVLPDNTV